MNPSIRFVFIVFAFIASSGPVTAQVNSICADSGATPALDSPFAHVPYVYGRVVIRGIEAGAKFPKVTVVLLEGQQSADRWTIDKSGNYCFKRKSSGGGTLTVEIDGLEVERRTLTSFGPAQQREDFEISMQSQKLGPPGVVSARFSHPANPQTAELYKQAVEAERMKDLVKAVDLVKEIVSIDTADFIAWAKLGSLYFEQNRLTDALAAFRKSVELKVEYTPAWISVGNVRVAQKQYEAAIEIFKHAAELDPTSARTFQLLGQTYLLARQGTLGVQALNEAIRLDPVGMAECHLQMAHLYELAGAKHLATREYKTFLTKVPDHPNKKKFEKYIKDNPE